MQLNMLDAKTRLSQLVDAAEHGEEVILARNGVPVAQIIPVRKRKLNTGFLKTKVGPVPDSLMFATSEEEANRFINGDD